MGGCGGRTKHQSVAEHSWSCCINGVLSLLTETGKELKAFAWAARETAKHDTLREASVAQQRRLQSADAISGDLPLQSLGQATSWGGFGMTSGPV